MLVYCGDPATIAAAFAIGLCGRHAPRRVWVALAWWCAVNDGPAVC